MGTSSSGHHVTLQVHNGDDCMYKVQASAKNNYN